MLTITPPMRFMIGERNVLFIVMGDHFDPSDIYIHVAIIIYIKWNNTIYSLYACHLYIFIANFRDRIRPPPPRSSRPPVRERYNSRERSISRERSLSRDRSWSSDRFSARDSSLNRERRSSRERPSSAPDRSKLSDRSASSFRNHRPRSRTPSPSPAGKI
jgi:hypothetical protein